MFTALVITVVAGYLLGSLPFGYLVARAHGVNIFEVGSKNPGATNVRRVLGRGPGNLVFALDALKGAAAVALPIVYFSVTHGAASPVAAGGTGQAAPGIDGREVAEVLGVISALLGHSFSCFTRFRGGKGVATGAGGFAVLFPPGVLIAAALWALAALATRYVSLASILAAISLPISGVVLHRSGVLIAASSLIAVIVILRHRANIARLVAGTENKIGRKKAASSP